MNDYLNRINAIQDGSTTLAAYTYLGSGMVVRIAYPEPTVWLDLWGGTTGTFNGIDLFNRVIDQRWQNSIGATPTDIDRYQYGYDQNSNRLYKANIVGTPVVSAGLDELYAYDPLNRLTQMQRGVLNSTKTALTGTPAREMDYTLDPTGNWNAYVTATAGTTDLNQTRTQNKVNEITAISASGGTPVWATPAYDAAGNMTTMPQVTTPTAGFTATYDAWNMMTSLSDSSGVVANYKYDGRMRRIVKVTAATSETRHFYYTNSWQDVEERVGTSTTSDLQYVWGIRYVDELVCRDDSNFTPSRLYACQDANFNLTSIADTTGAVQERYLFDPYGNRTVMDGATWDLQTYSEYGWVIGHQGLMHDSESGLIYNRERYLNAMVAMFGSRDRIEYFGGVNLYSYLKINPIMRLDPLGYLDISIMAFQIQVEDAARQMQAGGEVGEWVSDGLKVISLTISAVQFLDELRSSCSGSSSLGLASATGVASSGANPDTGNFGSAVNAVASSLAASISQPDYKINSLGLGDIANAQEEAMLAACAKTATAAKTATCPAPKKCKPCVPPVGTKAYREDTNLDSPPHRGVPVPHWHMYEMQQNPKNCQCFWHSIDDNKGGFGASPPPAGISRITPAGGGGSE